MSLASLYRGASERERLNQSFVGRNGYSASQSPELELPAHGSPLSPGSPRSPQEERAMRQTVRLVAAAVIFALLVATMVALLVATVVRWVCRKHKQPRVSVAAAACPAACCDASQPALCPPPVAGAGARAARAASSPSRPRRQSGAAPACGRPRRSSRASALAPAGGWGELRVAVWVPAGLWTTAPPVELAAQLPASMLRLNCCSAYDIRHQGVWEEVRWPCERERWRPWGASSQRQACPEECCRLQDGA